MCPLNEEREFVAHTFCQEGEGNENTCRIKGSCELIRFSLWWGLRFIEGLPNGVWALTVRQ